MCEMAFSQQRAWASVALAAVAFLFAHDARGQRQVLDLRADRTQVQVGETVTFTIEGAPSLQTPPATLDRMVARPVVSVYVFAFGDGTEQRTTEPSASHAYGRDETFAATVRVEQNGDPVVSSERVAISVTAPPVVRTVRLAARPPDATVGERVGFAARVEPAFGLSDRSARRIRYEFTFGDGTQQVTRTPEATVVYRRPDRYRAVVRVFLDGEEVAASPPVEVSVSPSPEPVAEPEAAPPAVRLFVLASTVTEGDPASFVASVDPPAAAGTYEYLFDFGDGERQRGPAARVSHTYSRAGPFIAVVHLFRRGERVARSQPRTVEVQPQVVEEPEAETPPPTGPEDQSEVEEPDPPGQAEPEVPVVPEVGDVPADPTTGVEPDTAESGPGSEIDATPEATVRLVVRPETPRAGEVATFSVRGVRPGADVQYRFDFGDGRTSGWVGVREAEATYEAGGTYDVTVEVRGLGGRQEATLRVVVAAASPAFASVPLWVLALVGALGLAGILGWRAYRRRRKTSPPPTQPPVPAVGLASRLDSGTTGIAARRPLAVECELRVRPVDDPGRHRVETEEIRLRELGLRGAEAHETAALE